MKNDHILWLDDVKLNDIDSVGGKNASLGEMICNLKQRGVNVPYGFVVTVNAYWQFVEYNKLNDSIQALIDKCDGQIRLFIRTIKHV